MAGDWLEATTFGIYLGAITVTYISLVLGYRLFLHPLRQYPGPFLAKLTDAYAGYYAATMDIHIKTRLDHLRYGPILRHGPNKLIFSSPKALQDIYLNERLSKSYAYQFTAATPGVYGVFNVIDKHRHRFKRKLVGQAISERSMKIFEPVMSEQIDIFLQVLFSSSESQDIVNMTEVVKRFTFDTVALLAFGRPLKTQTESKYRNPIQAQTAGNHRSNIFLQFPFLYKTKIFNFLELFASDQAFAYYNAIETMIASRLAEARDIRHDLYSIGTRACAGKAMAYAKASLLFAKVFWYFNFERPAGELGSLGAAA
ncbi:cytochrome P450 [Whalleya microplaca]|nr:cytochrome P450 [Whalleya microplaca]